jgi:anti-sigma factor RsiW
MTKDCLHFAPMIGARPGELPEAEASALSTHLEGCDTCHSLAAQLEATDGLLAEALLARANARDFAPFVDQVMARVGGRAGRSRPSLLDRLRQRWRLVIVSGAAVVALAGAATFMYVNANKAEEPERVAAVSMELHGGSTVLQTPDGPVVLLEPDDESGS